MTAQPQWSDSEQGDLLELVARGNVATDAADREWDFFVNALENVGAVDGRISANVMREHVRGVVAPKRIGAFTSRAVARGLIVPDGWELSDDRQGGNAGRPARCYRLTQTVPGGTGLPPD